MELDNINFIKNSLNENSNSKIICVCIWGFEEPMEMLLKENIPYDIYSSSLRLKPGITLSSSVIVHEVDKVFFWIYTSPKISMKVKEEGDIDSSIYCNTCRKIQKVIIQHSPWGRASDEGVLVTAQCTRCKKFI